MRKCAICGKKHNLFSIEFEETFDDDTQPETWTNYVCGTCWDHIAAIAQRALRAELTLLKQRLEKLEAAK